MWWPRTLRAGAGSQPARRWGPCSYGRRELGSANNENESASKFFPRASGQEPSMAETPRPQSCENWQAEPAGTSGLLTHRTLRPLTGFALSRYIWGDFLRSTRKTVHSLRPSPSLHQPCRVDSLSPLQVRLGGDHDLPGSTEAEWLLSMHRTEPAPAGSPEHSLRAGPRLSATGLEVRCAKFLALTSPWICGG